MTKPMAFAAQTAAPDLEPIGLGRAVTIYDVAAAAGVATSTVSRAFSRPGRVSAETASRIHAVAAELGYRGSAAIRMPTGSRSATIALALADVGNPASVSIIRGVQAVAAGLGFTVTLLDCDESETLERDSLDRVLPFVEGAILAGSQMSDRAVRTVAGQRPLVVLDRMVNGLCCVVPDILCGIRSALRHLHHLGHQTVAYAGGPAASWANGKRWRVVFDIGTELGLRVSRLGPYAPTLSGGAAVARDMRRHPATAVIAYNDLIAAGLTRGLAEVGVQVPGQLSVIGFDDLFGTGLFQPPLTTVATPVREMGTVAMLELCRLIRGSAPTEYPAIPLATQLIVRSTTGRNNVEARCS